MVVCNDKGGVGKSLLTALVAEQLGSELPTSIVEVEMRASFSQKLYTHPKGMDLRTILLVENEPETGHSNPSTRPLETLNELLPKRPEDSCRILIDFGASAFQTFIFWARDKRGLQPFRDAGFQFTFLIPVYASDRECADFFNENTPFLLRLGKVLLVRNHHIGASFPHLDPGILSTVPSLDLPFRGSPMSQEMVTPEQRLTFRQLAEKESASRRGRLDAKACDREFSEQFAKLRLELGL